MTSTITLTARELTALIAPVLPHASKDDVLPLLKSIFIRSTGPWVTAIATDRYRLGFQRVRPAQAPGDGFAAVLPLAVLARIRSTFKATRTTDPVIALTIDGTKLTVTTADALDGMVGATFEFSLQHDATEWPDVDRLLTGSLAAMTPTNPSSMLVNPVLLADFRIGQQRYEGMRATPTGDNSKPWLIRIGGDFIGLIVPMRGGHDEKVTDIERTGWLELLTAPAADVVAAA